MYTNHTRCRACKSEKLIPVFDLGIQPLSNDFVKEGEPHAGYAPLKVLFCEKCSLAQLSVVVDPAILYNHYSYVTSPSQMMRDHFRNLITDIAKETDGKNVLEIGSNDGRLLKMMKDGGGYNVVGVDPALNLAAIATENGIQTIRGMFCSALASTLSKVDIVIARHVFCHVDDWQDFIAGLELVSHPDTLICIEVPYVGDTLKKCEFDQTYHEHLSYLSINAMRALMEPSNLRLDRVIRYSIHGGAILLMLRRKDAPIQIVSLGDLEKENITSQDWAKFSAEARDQIGRLKATVDCIHAQGKTVAGLGASAKSTVWISACEFTRKDISFIADNTPQKQGTFSPGTDIPVVDEGAVLRDLPDYLIVFCWNFWGRELWEKFAFARAKGLKFIVPVPKIQVC